MDSNPKTSKPTPHTLPHLGGRRLGIHQGGGVGARERAREPPRVAGAPHLLPLDRTPLVCGVGPLARTHQLVALARADWSALAGTPGSARRTAHVRPPAGACVSSLARARDVGSLGRRGGGVARPLECPPSPFICVSSPCERDPGATKWLPKLLGYEPRPIVMSLDSL